MKVVLTLTREEIVKAIAEHVITPAGRARSTPVVRLLCDKEYPCLTATVEYDTEGGK